MVKGRREERGSDGPKGDAPAGRRQRSARDQAESGREWACARDDVRGAVQGAGGQSPERVSAQGRKSSRSLQRRGGNRHACGGRCKAPAVKAGGSEWRSPVAHGGKLRVDKRMSLPGDSGSWQGRTCTCLKSKVMLPVGVKPCERGKEKGLSLGVHPSPGGSFLQPRGRGRGLSHTELHRRGAQAGEATGGRQRVRSQCGPSGRMLRGPRTLAHVPKGPLLFRKAVLAFLVSTDTWRYRLKGTLAADSKRGCYRTQGVCCLRVSRPRMRRGSPRVVSFTWSW